MASTIKIKRSNVAGNVPDSTTTPPQIVEGELALNTADRLLYSHGSNTTFEIGANTSSASIKGTKVAATDFSYSPTPAEKEDRLNLRVENVGWGGADFEPTLSKGLFEYSNTQNGFTISYRDASNNVDIDRKQILSEVEVGDVMWVVDDTNPEYRWGITVYAIEHNTSADTFRFRSASGVSPSSFQSGTAFGYEKLTTEAVHANADTNITVAAQEYFKNKDVYVYFQKKSSTTLRATHSKNGVPLFQANGVASHTSLQDAKNSFQTTFHSATTVSPLTDTETGKSYFSTQAGMIDLFIDYTQGGVDKQESLSGIEQGDVISVVLNSDVSKRVVYTVNTGSPSVNGYIRAYTQQAATDYVSSNLDIAALQAAFAGETATITIIKRAQILPFGKFDSVTANDYSVKQSTGQANTVIRSDCRVLAPHAAENRFELACLDNTGTGTTSFPDASTEKNSFFFAETVTSGDAFMMIRTNQSNTLTAPNLHEFLPCIDEGDIVHITSKNDSGKYWSGVVTAVSVVGYDAIASSRGTVKLSFGSSPNSSSYNQAFNIISNQSDNYINYAQENPNDMFAGTDVYLSVTRASFLPKVLAAQPTPHPSSFSLSQYLPKVMINGSHRNHTSGANSVSTATLYRQTNEIGIQESGHGSLSSSYVSTIFKIHTSNQGWAWKTHYHGQNQAAMSLDGSGNLDVADSITAGRGTSNTVDISSSYTIYASGQIFATSNITAYSDRRAKENIKPINDGLEKVLKMQGVYYNMKECDAKEEGKKKRVGVIAQDIEKILPEVVCYSKDTDVYSVDYGNITAILIEAIKDQQKIIDKLEERIQIIERSE